MKAKKLMAGVLTAGILLEQALPGMSTVFAADAENGSAPTFNKEGVWLTEIYQNDVDRSAKNDKRADSGYEEIPTYSSTTDLMEFIEITSTHEGEIKLNDLYDVYYNDGEKDYKLDITYMDNKEAAADLAVNENNSEKAENDSITDTLEDTSTSDSDETTTDTSTPDTGEATAIVDTPENIAIAESAENSDIAGMADNGDVTISKGQSVVLWNVRTDVKNIPTEAEFRSQMRVPENALVLKAVCGVNWKADGATFTIKTKDGVTVSTFTATDKVHTQDGFSVELKIPDIGAQMQVYREINLPSAGYVYSGQLNGLVTARVPDDTSAKGVYLTEIRPNDTNRSGAFGIDDDLMECFEVNNTTDKAVDLNKDYQLFYVVKEGYRKPIPMYHYAENTVDMSSEGCTIPAGGTAVIWCYRKDHLKGYTSFPTEADFREAYGVPENVLVYLFTNQNGVNNTLRGVEIYENQEDGSRALVSYYSYVGGTDCKDNKSAQLMVNPEGPEMLLYAANAGTSMGTVDPEQLTYVKDDGTALTISLNDTIPEFITQGDELRVDFEFSVPEGGLPRTGITTYYRFDGEGSWHASTEAKRRVPDLYEVLIPADELFSHKFVEFYVSADNRYRSTLSPIYTVKIRQLNEVDGIRSSITDGEQVNGTISVAANNGGDNTNNEIYLDGEKLTLSPMLEDGAYFTFHASGRDSYFKNAVTTTDNEWIAAIGKWQYTILDGQAIHVDNRYFTYNAGNNSYDITLRFWAGTYGATVDEYLLPDANREDFTVTQLALRLINGNTYYPTDIGPKDEATSAKTNLSTDYDAVHSVGDSNGWCPYLDVSFSVPASEVTAMGAQVDTTKLTDGEHSLVVSDGTSRESKTIKFIVDNKAPEIDIGVADGEVLGGIISLDPKTDEEDNLEKFNVTLDGEEIEIPYDTTAYALGEGKHTIAAYAEDKAGNVTTKTAEFTVNNVNITLSEGGVTDITDSSARLYLSLESGSDTTATFYQAEKIDTGKIETNTASGILPYIQYTIDVGEVGEDRQILVSWDGTASGSDNTHASTLFVQNTENGKWDKVASANEDGSIPTAFFTAKNHVKDGKATVIVQCTADSALPELDTSTDGKKDNNANWDGTGRPEDYDFCFAWETDTQYYAEEWPHHFENMNRWIVDNAEDWKIKYTIHTGDIVDDCDMIYQWENADKYMKILDDGEMPYGVLGGNHDVAAGLGDYENYYTYFGEDRFISQPTYGGSYKNNTGHYDLISEKGQDFIIVYMSWNIYQEELDWMNDILKQYSDRKAILCFHTYTRVAYSGDSLMDYFGELVQKEVVAKNSNVFAVLNGHYHGSSYETAMFDDDGDGVKERTVYQICTDYQSGFEGGNEYIKFLYFDLDNDKIYMNSYSPCLNDFNFYDDGEVEILNREGASKTALDKMLLDVKFNTDQQTILEKSFNAYLCDSEAAGSADVDSTGKASVDLKNLEPETEYFWYGVVSNKDGAELKTSAYSFTTDKAAATEPDDSNNSGTGVIISSPTIIDNESGSQTTPPDADAGTNSQTTPPDVETGSGSQTTTPDVEAGSNSQTPTDGKGNTPEANPSTGVPFVALPLALMGLSVAGLCTGLILGKKHRH